MVSAKAKNKSFKEIYLRASSFCAYQERTQQEVRDKLYGEDVDKDVIEEIITNLITDNFLNEERFAKTYAGGKFRMKKWGRMKIIHALKGKGISQYCINKGMAEIEDSQYQKTLRELLKKKWEEEKESNIYKKKSKISMYVIRKGYEPELVWEVIRDLFES